MPIRFLAVFVFVSLAAPTIPAQCPEEPRLDNFDGAGRVSCPCFIEGEHAGAVFTLPAGEFPIEILRVGVGWGSQFGGNPAQIEDSINIYEGGLPDPGTPIFTLEAPELNDGFINEFDLEPQPGEVIVNSSPFTVTLRFLNDNANMLFSPSTVHDNATCTPGKNVVFAIPGGWTDGCSLGISGDWVFYVVWRPATCGGSGGGSVPDGALVPGNPMRVERLVGNDLRLSWDASCDSGDDDYEIYEGSLGFYYSHFSRLCTTGGATDATLTPASGDRYFIVVPANAGGEGSYGRDSAGGERPTGGGACLAQQTIACP